MTALDRVAYGLLVLCSSAMVFSGGYRLLTTATTPWDAVFSMVVIWGFAYLVGVLMGEWVADEARAKRLLARVAATTEAEQKARASLEELLERSETANEKLFAEYPYLALKHTCMNEGGTPGRDQDCPRCCAIWGLSSDGPERAA
jgi:hypothetical protein